jgi:uncharacterized membrane protein HdeD (DUF308 family)
MLRTHFLKSMSYSFLNSLQPLILLNGCVTSVSNWGLMLFSGITALVFALIIVISWSEAADWLLGLLLGINMIFLDGSLVKIGLH